MEIERKYLDTSEYMLKGLRRQRGKNMELISIYKAIVSVLVLFIIFLFFVIFKPGTIPTNESSSGKSKAFKHNIIQI